MPVYSYVCRRCGHAKRVMHKMSESPAVLCDYVEASGCVCSEKMVKGVSRSSFSLRGNGWERDGYGG